MRISSSSPRCRWPSSARRRRPARGGFTGAREALDEAVTGLQVLRERWPEMGGGGARAGGPGGGAGQAAPGRRRAQAAPSERAEPGRARARSRGGAGPRGGVESRAIRAGDPQRRLAPRRRRSRRAGAGRRPRRTARLGPALRAGLPHGRLVPGLPDHGAPAGDDRGALRTRDRARAQARDGHEPVAQLALPAALRAPLPSALHDLRGHQHLPRLGPAALTAGGVRRGPRRRPRSNNRGPPIGRLGALAAGGPDESPVSGGWRFSAAGVRCALKPVGDVLHSFAIARRRYPAFVVSFAAAAGCCGPRSRSAPTRRPRSPRRPPSRATPSSARR